MKPANDLLLGYYATMDGASEDALVAALLVTNQYGLPVEFRYTEPVTTTDTQRTLYGSSDLEGACAVSMAASLWRSVQARPRVVFVEDATAMRFWEHLGGRHSALVARLEPLTKDVHAHGPSDGLVVRCEAAEAGRARVRLLSGRQSEDDEWEGLLAHAADTMNLEEPFARVEAILRSLHKLPESRAMRRTPGEFRSVGAEQREPAGPAANQSGPQPKVESLAARPFRERPANAGNIRRRARPVGSSVAAARPSEAGQPAAEPGSHARPGRHAARSPEHEQIARAAAEGEAADAPDGQPDASSTDSLKTRPDLQWMFHKSGK